MCEDLREDVQSEIEDWRSEREIAFQPETPQPPAEQPPAEGTEQESKPEVQPTQEPEAQEQLPAPPSEQPRVLWKPQPNLETAAIAWIYAGGAHHTCYSQNISVESLHDFAEIMDIELLLIDAKTDLYRFKQELRWNEIYYASKKGY